MHWTPKVNQIEVENPDANLANIWQEQGQSMTVVVTLVP